MKNNFNLLGVNVSLDSEDNSLEIIRKYIKNAKRKTQNSKEKQQKPFLIFTPNPEIVMYSQQVNQFREAVNKAQINIPDGVGIVLAGKLLGGSIVSRITGVDLASKMLKLAVKQSVTVGLIGGFDGLADKALECLMASLPGLKGWAEDGPVVRIKNPQLAKAPSGRQNNDLNLKIYQEFVTAEKFNSRTSIKTSANQSLKQNQSLALKLGYDNWDLDKFIKRVKDRKTKILFVGFGFPKQEYFIDEISEKLDNIILIAVGGTFNYWSGRIKRAPLWMQKSGVEWLYRLIKEPWRLRRQLVLPGFVIRVLIHKVVKTLKLNQYNTRTLNH